MSKRYIDAELAEENIRKWLDVKPSVPRICKKVEDIAVNAVELTPTADVAEVRHGHWKYVDGDLGYSDLECSECRATTAFFDDERFNYCPNCGAKMDGERSTKDAT